MARRMNFPWVAPISHRFAPTTGLAVIRNVFGLATSWLRESAVVVDGSLWVRDIGASRAIGEIVGKSFKHAGRGFPGSLSEGVAYSHWWDWVRKNRHYPRTPAFAVLLSPRGQFGNFLIQLNNGAELSRVGRSNLVITRPVDFRPSKWRPVPHDFDPSSWPAYFRESFRLNDFSYLRSRRTLEHTVVWKTNGMRGLRIFSGRDTRVWEDMKAELKPALLSGVVVERGNSALTIHLRGGDIFGARPHAKYGQPPLSFYLFVLESEGPWSNVHLVTEDFSNPCVHAILEWCQQRDLAVEVSGSSFSAAIHEIARARNLVLSRGSFARTTSSLLGNPRKLWVFGEALGPGAFQPKVKVRSLTDSRGIYLDSVMGSNWRNLPWQRSLMLSYSREWITTCPSQDGTVDDTPRLQTQ